MGLQTVQSPYLISDLGKRFENSKQQKSTKKVNNNNKKGKNEQIKPRNNIAQIDFFKKIANNDKKALPDSPKVLNFKNKDNNNIVIVPNRFFNNIYDGFNWNSDKYENAWSDSSKHKNGLKDVSIASIYASQHLPKDLNKSKHFPKSNLLFAKEKPKPKPFNIPIVRSSTKDRPKEKRLFYRKSISYKYISFKSIDNLKCFNVPMDELNKISRPPSFKKFPSTWI